MIELITSISLFASAVSLQAGANGIATIADITASTTASTTAIEQTVEEAQADRIAAYKAQIAYVKSYFKDDPILVDVARCESAFRQFGKDGKVIRGLVNPKDVGIMQINEEYHLAKSKSLGYDIYTVDGNLGYAKYMYENQGASPWLASSKCWSKSIAMK
jgi:hypothetical protein